MDDRDQAAAGCLTVLLQFFAASLLFGYAARRDREWAALEAQQRDEGFLRWITLSGAQEAAHRWNLTSAEFDEATAPDRR